MQKMTGVADVFPATPGPMSLRASVSQRVRQSPPLTGYANPIWHNRASRNDGTERLSNILYANIKAHFSYMSQKFFMWSSCQKRRELHRHGQPNDCFDSGNLQPELLRVKTCELCQVEV